MCVCVQDCLKVMSRVKQTNRPEHDLTNFGPFHFVKDLFVLRFRDETISIFVHLVEWELERRVQFIWLNPVYLCTIYTHTKKYYMYITCVCVCVCKSPTLFPGSTNCLIILLIVRLPVHRVARALHHMWDMNTHSSSSVITFYCPNRGSSCTLSSPHHSQNSSVSRTFRRGVLTKTTIQV